MNVRSANTFWLESQRAAMPKSYPAPEKTINCDVLIIGGGITGALVAYELVRAGIDTVLIDKRTLGKGSTAASTALIQYEIDVTLHQLIVQIGEQEAVLAYKLCLEAIYKLGHIVSELDSQCGFNRKQSLYIANQPADVEMLRYEFEARARHGFRVPWLNRGDIRHAEEHLTWAGTFAETKDGLPYIGEHDRYPHSYFALGFGGNGITFSITAANIIRNLFQTGKSEPADVFRFGR